MFARTKIRNQIHGAGTIQRDQGNNVFKAIRFRLDQHVAHAATFQLEHRRRIGRLK